MEELSADEVRRSAGGRGALCGAAVPAARLGASFGARLCAERRRSVRLLGVIPKTMIESCFYP